MTQSLHGAVDVILTCYEEGDYIGQAIRSILNQTWSNRVGRIVISDDGSSADTVAALKEIEGWDPRILVLYGPGGIGLPGQRNLALRESTSEYFAILDGDDYWVPEKLEHQLPLLDADHRIGLVYSDYFAFPGGRPEAARRAGVINLSGAKNLSHSYFLNDPPIVPSTTVIRRSVFEKAGRFDASIRLFEDTDMWLRLAQISRFGCVEVPLLYKRYHVQSMTGGQRDLMPDHTYIAMKAVSYDPSLLPLLPRRLSERARKLGNHRFLQGDAKEAARLLRLAIRLQPLNMRAWSSWVMAALVPNLSYRLLKNMLRRRRQALGIEQ
jgi:glycosyltransferase involved in cell wall biosynthesis